MNWVTLDLSADYAEMRNEPHNADYRASCGEYLSARIMAAYLDWSFVDTEFCVFFDEKGRLDRRRTKRALQEKLGGDWSTQYCPDIMAPCRTGRFTPSAAAAAMA